ncbi:MAG: hypothetical protein Q9208_005636 [Pyrenodesmia sp. 3 TL-2023]
MPPRHLTTALRPLIPLARHRLATNNTRALSSYPPTPRRRSLPSPAARPTSIAVFRRRRQYATKSTADEAIEEITEIYATAKDEFDIATEETSKRSVYAADDRAAAREELDKLKRAYEAAIGGTNGEEVRRRVGGRVRELERGVEALEERAMEGE